MNYIKEILELKKLIKKLTCLVGNEGGIGVETDPSVPQYVKGITEDELLEWNTRYTNTDENLIINGKTINFAMTIYEESFNGLQTFTLSFVPISIEGVYVNGLRLDYTEFVLVVATKKITIVQPITNQKITVRYRHEIVSS